MFKKAPVTPMVNRYDRSLGLPVGFKEHLLIDTLLPCSPMRRSKQYTRTDLKIHFSRRRRDEILVSFSFFEREATILQLKKLSTYLIGHGQMSSRVQSIPLFFSLWVDSLSHTHSHHGTTTLFIVHPIINRRGNLVD
jgi:hypothetical protein